MNKFNEQEFLEICKKLNTQPYSEDITITYERDSYFNKLRHAVSYDRRGEVVFCVIRPNGKVITVTCSEYPEDIYRIPTGGIGHHEDIVTAANRETYEELGLQADMVKFAGVLKIKFMNGSNFVMFYSYIFIMKETGGNLLKDATDDEVSEVREVSIEELFKVADKLNNINGKWHDWGRFRYVTTNAVARYLKEHEKEIFGNY